MARRVLSNPGGRSIRVLSVVADAGVPDWEATDVAGCIFWVRAGLGVTGTTNVTTWADQSGNGFDLTAPGLGANPSLVAADPQFNDRNSISFTPDDYMTTSTFASQAQPTTWYCVCRFNSVAASDFLWDASTSSNVGERQVMFFNPGWAAYAGTEFQPGPSPATATTIVLCVIFDGVSSQIYVSSTTPLGTGDAGSDPFTGVTIGARYQLDAGSFLDGKVAELIAYTGAHSAPTRSTVLQALGGLYGVTIAP